MDSANYFPSSLEDRADLSELYDKTSYTMEPRMESAILKAMLLDFLVEAKFTKAQLDALLKHIFDGREVRPIGGHGCSAPLQTAIRKLRELRGTSRLRGFLESELI